jgi:hypothetical protein
MATTNTFWITGNILFDLETGKRTDVLMLTSSEGDATTFTESDADNYKSFIERRANIIQWAVMPSTQSPGKFVIRGVQNVG